MNWSINVDWEYLESGSDEERACFAAIGVQAEDTWLTEGWDELAKRLRKSPFLSAYHLAEWIAWNWWRLRWEPLSNTPDWAFAHRLSTIGGGYIWPNVTIFSDGERVALVAKPTHERRQTLFRYIADAAVVIRASEFESVVDSFIDQALERLESQNLLDTNLSSIWGSVREERNTPEEATRRKLEALLGQEPDESDTDMLQHLMSDGNRLGMAAIAELAADHGPGGRVLVGSDLEAMAKSGFDATPRDMVRLETGSGMRQVGQVPAWYLGSDMARALRRQEGLDGNVISNRQLADLAATSKDALSGPGSGTDISFALENPSQHGRIVLRSKWEAGRRFELARLLGDHMVFLTNGRLFPATKSRTYRQKFQRSFAAELLSPFEKVDEMLGGDFSTEKQQEVADYFKVSELTIRTLLVNHKRLDREDLLDREDFSDSHYSTVA